MGHRSALGLTIAGLSVAGVLGLSVAAARSTQEVVTIHVRGAHTLSVYCGGEETVHVRGDEAKLVPATAHCFIEAPLSPVMPLRGELEIGGRSRVDCDRVNMTLDCN